MNRIKSSYNMVILNGEISSAQKLNPVPSGISVVYEVIRVMAAVPLFIEAHLERMNRSLQLAGFPEALDLRTVKEAIHDLTEVCSVRDQNIRLNVWQEDCKIFWTGFFVDSIYPEPDVYKEGVQTGLLRMKRSNPNAKVWQANLKDTVERQCKAKNLYEMILVDPEGFISEGSRSNLFFTRGNQVFTAPDEDVLEGITRLELLALISERDIPLVKRKIPVSELDSFDGAFITGTSIHLLPVTRIDAWERQSSEQPLIRFLMDQFDKAVKEYALSYTYE